MRRLPGPTIKARYVNEYCSQQAIGPECAIPPSLLTYRLAKRSLRSSFPSAPHSIILRGIQYHAGGAVIVRRPLAFPGAPAIVT